MTETQRRIRAYKRALPELRERVVAVALLLAMSASMLASASFAWVTLSTSPEVTGMATTVAANGNLEIALASGDMWDENGSLKKAVEPEESKVGDSSAKEGNTIQGANTQWGNLVNISYGYGLDQIALRPALLGSDLTNYPLSGAAYGQDGRVINTQQDYEFASYGYDEQFQTNMLLAGDKVEYGVRAVASVGRQKVEQGNLDKKKEEAISTARNYYAKAAEHYARLISNGSDAIIVDESRNYTAIKALQELVSIYANSIINGSNGDCGDYLEALYRMMQEMRTVLEYEGQALMALANYQALAAGVDTGLMTFTDLEDFLTYTDEALLEKGVTLTTFDSVLIEGVTEETKYDDGSVKKRVTIKDEYTGFKTDWNNLQAAMKKMEGYIEIEKTGADVYWGTIQSAINPIVNIDSAKLGDVTIGLISSDQIGSLIKSLVNTTVTIRHGVLRNMDGRIIPNANRVNAKVSVSVTYGITMKLSATVKTLEYGESNSPKFYSDLNRNVENNASGPASAKDTYGLALDLWVRTNYPNAYLTLEGAVEYLETPVTITVPVRNEDGTESAEETENLELHTTKLGDNDIETQVYQQNGKWYRADNREEVTLTGSTTRLTEKTAVGYHGENRIWEDWQTKLDAGLIAEDSTTQGAGSCFVFYADTPTEQQKIKEMLEAFNVVFMGWNENGDEMKVLGSAKLNVENSIAVNGKVTVPLEMESGEDFTDESGTTQTGIMQLTQNEATYITALVYLNGSQLQNENVLASGELTGQLNIQFGTSGTLVVKDDEELMGQYRTITAAVTVDGQTVTDTTTLNYSETGHKANVTLTVDGDQPDHITGFFLRKINSTQGTRTEEMQFEKKDDGTWAATTTLTNPGNYVFNTLLVDGVEYTLKEDNQSNITIEGLNLSSVWHSATNPQYMLAESSMAVEVSVGINADYPVEQVTAQFFSTDNTKQFTAILTGNGENWTGTANITASGTYSLKYVTVNGQTLEVENQSQFTVRLGLSAMVRTTAYPTSWVHDAENLKQLPMQVEILDNAGERIEGLEGVQLYYTYINNPAVMTWNATAGYYEGCLEPTDVGTFNFDSLKLGNMGILYSTRNEAPEFSATSTTPPSYQKNNTVEKQTVISGDAIMAIQTADAAASNVWAEGKTPSGKTFLLLGSHGQSDSNYLTFTLLNTDDQKEDGLWTMEKLYFRNRTAGLEDPKKDSLVIDVSDQNITTEVIANIYSKVYYNGSADETPTNQTFHFGGDATAATADFLTKQTSGSLRVELMDYAGNAIDGLTGVTWNITAPTDTQSHGGYTITTQNTNLAKADTVSVSENGITCNVDGVDITTAGKYTMSLTAQWKKDENTSASVDIPWTVNFEVWSKKPTVKVTGVDTIGNSTNRVYFEDGEINSLNNLRSGDFASVTDYSAAVYVYFKATSNLDDEAVLAKLPVVTLSLSGVNSNYTSAKIAFVGRGANNQDTYVFDFGTNTTAQQSIGKKTDGEFDKGFIGIGSGVTKYPVIYPAGKMVQDTIDITCNGITYTAKLSHAITINNPLYPPYVNVTINDETYSGTKSYTLYSQDGETVTLPAVNDWIIQKAESADLPEDLSGLTPTTTTQKIAVWVEKSGNIIKTDKYNKYTVTTKVYTLNATSTVYSVTKHLKEWTIDGKPYQGGETITLTGGHSATATITETNNKDAQTVTATMVRTVTTYTLDKSKDTLGWNNQYTVNDDFDPTKLIPDTGWQRKS